LLLISPNQKLGGHEYGKDEERMRKKQLEAMESWCLCGCYNRNKKIKTQQSPKTRGFADNIPHSKYIPNNKRE